MSELAWAAGFFDGEGWIGTSSIEGRRYLRLNVSQKDSRPLERFIAALGVGRVTSGGTNHGMKAVQYSGLQALGVAGRLWPFLSAPKREQFMRTAKRVSDRVRL